MAALVSYKRPVVLSLGELQRYPTTTDRYAVTLPFNDTDMHLNYSCVHRDLFAKNRAKAIKQTEKRWAWFSEARRMDDSLGTRLGTLGYLPPEIRYEIWVAVIENDKVSWDTSIESIEYRFWRAARIEISVIGTLEFMASHRDFSRLDIFHLNSYYHLRTGEGSAMRIRYASAQAKIELENTFIFTNAFGFHCPKHLKHFLDQLSADQESLLRSITIWLLGCWECSQLVDEVDSVNCACQAWVPVMERLPATLKSITLDFLGVETVPTRHEFLRSQTPKAIESVRRMVKPLGMITKRIQRQAPGVIISMNNLDCLIDEDRESFQTMLDEISPFSKDFIRWSDESRKNAVAHGKGN